MTITFCDFDFSFLKMILKSTLYGILQGEVYLSFSVILKQINSPFPILWQSLYSPFSALFVYVSYAKNLINIFHNLNLALHTVSSLHSIQKATRNSWKYGNKMEAVKRFKARKRGKSNWQVMVALLSNVDVYEAEVE